MSQTTFSTESESQTSQSSECSTRHKINANKMLAVRCLAEISIESEFWEPSKITLREKLCFSHFKIGGLSAGGVRMRRWYIISISICTMRKNLFCRISREFALFLFSLSGRVFFSWLPPEWKSPRFGRRRSAQKHRNWFSVYFSAWGCFSFFFIRHIQNNIELDPDEYSFYNIFRI